MGIASIIWMFLSARKEKNGDKDSEKSKNHGRVTVVDSQEPIAQEDSADTVSVDDKGTDSPTDDTVEDDKVTEAELDSAASQSSTEGLGVSKAVSTDK